MQGNRGGGTESYCVGDETEIMSGSAAQDRATAGRKHGLHITRKSTKVIEYSLKVGCGSKCDAAMDAFTARFGKPTGDRSDAAMFKLASGQTISVTRKPDESTLAVKVRR